MNAYYLLLGILLVFLGILIISYYYKLKKNEKGVFSFKLLSGGYGFIIIGVGLILRELF